MRYLTAGLIATIGIRACTEPGRQILAPTAATNCREATQIAVDTIIEYDLRSTTFLARRTRSLPTFPKSSLVGNASVYLAASFVIDTSGYVIGPSVQIESAPWPLGDQVFCDWLRHAQFEP